MLRILSLLLLLPVLAGCEPEPVELYQTRGEVVALKPEMDAIAILHEDVPGFMDSMQMDFSVAEMEEMTGLTPGDKVAFTIAIAEDGETTIRDLQKLPETAALVLDKPAPPVLSDSLLLDSLRADSLRLDSLSTLDEL
jgi:Cu/Ag efflux protein CusF